MNDRDDDSYFVGLRFKVIISSLVLIIISLIFWIWALINCFKDGIDLGVLSFLFPFFGGLFGISTTKFIVNPRNRVMKQWSFYAKMHLYLTSFGCFIVAANYFLGVLLAQHKGYLIYCIIFTILWIIAGVIFTKWGYKWKNDFCLYTKRPHPLNN